MHTKLEGRFQLKCPGPWHQNEMKKSLIDAERNIYLSNVCWKDERNHQCVASVVNLVCGCQPCLTVGKRAHLLRKQAPLLKRKVALCAIGYHFYEFLKDTPLVTESEHRESRVGELIFRVQPITVQHASKKTIMPNTSTGYLCKVGLLRILR